MKKKSDNFFTEDEKERIGAAIRDAEAATSGEIVAMVVDRSDGYKDVDVFVSILLAAFAAFYPAEMVFIYLKSMLDRIIPGMGWMNSIPDTTRFMAGLLAFVAITLVFYHPFRLLMGRVPAFKRFFIPVQRRDAEVRERALAEFREQGLDRTRDATGILFLISLFEKRVYVLADHGIYEKIKQETLDMYAATVSLGLREKRGADALCSAIKSAGVELSKHFPGRADDVNELPNNLVSK